MEQKERRPHPFDIMVMGRREEPSAAEQEDHPDYETEEEPQENEDLMSHIENLMTAVSDLKPLFHKVMPFITKWTKS
jgi:hypothetical protein